MKKAENSECDNVMTNQETQTTFNYVKYIVGGNNGGVIHYNDYCIHPMAFVGVKWNMNECDDGYIRPFVCDTTVSHHAVDEHNSRYDAIIEPWVENKVLE